MDVTPLVRKGQKIIQRYSAGVFKVSGQSYDYPILVSPDYIDEWDIGSVSGVDDLVLEHFQFFIDRADQIDVVLFGSGSEMAFLPKDVRLGLQKAGVQIDAMTTGAACRTYNVLMAEGRRVACALLLG